jgi:sigma-B regulation protein RsbU (phosphoserine phosphatase)
MPTATAELDLEAIEKLREEELDEARAIQSGMLPSQPLRVGGITISHEFQPAALVGGDYLDYFLPPDGMIGMYVGDVSGKGLPAAMYAALAVGTLRGIHKTGQHPTQVLALLNKRLLLRGIPARYTAIQYALLDPLTGRMHIASAGMPGPTLLRGQEGTVLRVTGIPPGLFAEVNSEHLTVQLEPVDSLLFYTDGLTDAQNLPG